MVVSGIGWGVHWEAEHKAIGGTHCNVGDNLQISRGEKIPSQTPGCLDRKTQSRHTDIFISLCKAQCTYVQAQMLLNYLRI